MDKKEAASVPDYHHHMAIPWVDFVTDDNVTPAREASLVERSMIVGRIGLMILACGTGSWRVRDSMNVAARTLGMTCSADIGLVSIEYTCIDNNQSYTQAIALPTTGVNTARLDALERFTREMERDGAAWTVAEIYQRLTKIQKMKANYQAWQLGLGSAMACSAFVFLLGGGLVEMFCSFIGAGAGTYVRKKMGEHHITLLAGVTVAVATACLIYGLAFLAFQYFFQVSARHEAGYIGAMLFIIPGFPFVTAGLDLAKLDMRSGLERAAYSILIITVATLVGWLVALMVNLRPEAFAPQALTAWELLGLRLVASFVGVYGFSMLFNSPPKMAATAAVIGAVGNTLRLELVGFHMPPAAAAFIGALVCGLLAAVVRRRAGYPRIALTIPSVVIMVPGLYMYRAVYSIGLQSINSGASWLTKALLIVIFIPLGQVAARVLTDTKWRHNG